MGLVMRWIWFGTLAATGAACLATDARHCDDGSLCPPRLACAPAGGCVDRERLDACVGVAADAECVFAGGVGACVDEVCEIVVCGDGKRVGREVCDDGNRVDGDGCDAFCASREVCGNGIRDVSEACDDGNAVAGDGCDPACQLPACGDGITDAGVGEQCDDGNVDDGDGCDGRCRLEVCGNGVRDVGEACDLGPDNADTPDAPCRTTCELPDCGDGIVDLARGEACDAGPANSAAPDAPCRLDCQAPRCGDGVHDVLRGEACDDGNLEPGDGCSFDCGSDETCGNGSLDFFAGEQCDDGGVFDLDGCTPGCKVQPRRWHKLDSSVSPPGRTDYGLAYDAGRERVVLFGGWSDNAYVFRGDTWEWDGAVWTQMDPPVSPPARWANAMAYDAARREVVMFGGQTPADNVNDTWTWNGAVWTERQPAVSPPFRTLHALTYDAGRARVVMFGGEQNDSTIDRVWEWDGETWALNPATGGPGGSGDQVLTYDPNRQALQVDDPGAGALWEFDGTAWTATPIIAGHPSFNEPATAYDPFATRTVAYAGRNWTTDTTWQLVGTDWSDISPVGAPSQREGTSMVFDLARQEALLFSGYSSVGGDKDETWIFDGAAWRLAGQESQPLPRTYPAMAYDKQRRELVMFGGAYQRPGWADHAYGDTWTMGGTRRWLARTSPQIPAARHSAGMVWDERRGRTLLFGGIARSGWSYLPRTDTWQWDGEAWTQLATAAIPSECGRGSTYDVAADRVFMPCGQTLWAFDGVDWVDTGTALPDLAGIQLVHDSVRATTLLIGERGEAPYRNETWALVDGGFELQDASLPWGVDFVVGEDLRRGRVVLHGGFDHINVLDGTFEWTGVTWQRIDELGFRRAHKAGAMAYDAARGELAIFAGYFEDRFTRTSDTWTFRYSASVTPESCFEGVDTDLDGADGCDDVDCWWACAPSCPPVLADAGACDPLALDAPSCGDGVCAIGESCRFCPDDCGACAGVCGDLFCDAPEDDASCPADC